MAVTLTAAQCPAIQVAADFPTRAAAFSAGRDADMLTSRAIPGAGGTSITAEVNSNAVAHDLLGRYGGGAYAIGTGLGLSAPGGLTVGVAAGHAIIDGIAEVAAATTLAVSAVAAPDRVWVWISRGGTLQYTVTATAPAQTGPWCLLGSCSTALGSVSDLDTSGVMYLRGGVPYRETADVGAPGDTPPAGVQFVAKTAGGVYWWTGSTYQAYVGAVVQTLAPQVAASELAAMQTQLDEADRLRRKLLGGLVMLGFTDLLSDPDLVADYQAYLSER